ncbi:MAG: hypothetical protein ABIZ36_03215 [Gemmatimonadaceae bacterium]
MTDRARFSDDERAREAIRDQADEIRQLDSALSRQIRDDQYPATMPEEPAVFPERLFSRKVLFGWAFAALIFVFLIRMVLPVVFETVKESVVSSMKDATHNTGSSPGAPVVAPTPPLPPTSVTPAVPEVPERPGAPTVAPPRNKPATAVQGPLKKSPR